MNTLHFLEEQLLKVEEKIKKRNYSSDIEEQILLWKLYELIRFLIEGVEKKYVEDTPKNKMIEDIKNSLNLPKQKEVRK